MDRFGTKTKVAGVIVSGLLAIGILPAVDLALVDSVSLQPIEGESSIFGEHIREYGQYTVVAKDFAMRDGTVGYCAEGNCINFTPAFVSWDSGEQIREAPSVLSKRAVEEKSLKYDSVFGFGFDLDIGIEPDRFSKHIGIESLERLGEIPEQAKTLDLYFAVDSNLELRDGSIDSGYKLSLYSQIMPPQVWDSSKDSVRQSIHSEIVTIGDTQYLVKHIPVEFLKQAVFPIFSDADITYGTAVLFTATAMPNPYDVRIAAIDTDQLAVCYYGSTANRIDCAIGTVSGGIISYGATTTVSANDSYVGDGSQPTIAVCKAATDKFAVVYADDSQLDDGYVVINSVSGSTITVGTPLEFLTTDMEAPSCAQLNTDKIAIGYNNETGDQVEVKACTISTLTPTCGTAKVVTTDAADSTSISQMDTDKFVLGYTDETTLGFNMVIGTVSGTTVTTPTHTLLEVRPANNGSDQLVVTGMGTNRFAGTYNDNTTLEWNVFVGTSTGTTIGGLSTSTILSQPTNGQDFGNVKQIGADTFVITSREFEGINAANRNYTRIGVVNWNNLALTMRDRDIMTSRAQEAYSIDVAVLGTGNVVVCTSDSLLSVAGYCHVGSVNPAIDTYTATNIASTTATLNGDVLYAFDTTYSAGFVYGVDSVWSATTTALVNQSTAQALLSNITGLTPFQEYGFRAFATTSLISALYDNDTFQFFTADISTSTPVVAADKHAWNLATFSAGTHATTTTMTSGTVLLLAPTSRTAAPTLIATSTHVFAGASTTQSISIPGAATTDDLVLVYGTNDVSPLTAGAWVTSAGWTNLVPDGANSLPGYSVDYKVMGETPDTSFTIVDSGNVTRSSKYIVEVWRNVDIYQPIDNSFSTAASASGMPNSPSHTTLTDNSVVIAAGFLDDKDASTSTPPTGYGGMTTVGTDIPPDPLGATLMVASKVLATAGAENPDIFGGVDTDDWRAVTFALRPQQVFDDPGFWIAPSWDIGSIENVFASWIEYSSTTPSDSIVSVKTAVNTSATVPPAVGDFVESASGGSISGISASDDLTGKYLWVGVELTPSTDANYTPSLLQYIVGINSAGAAASNRRILFPN